MTPVLAPAGENCRSGVWYTRSLSLVGFGVTVRHARVRAQLLMTSLFEGRTDGFLHTRVAALLPVKVRGRRRPRSALLTESLM